MFMTHGPELDAELAYRRETLMRPAARPVARRWRHHLPFAAPRPRG